MQSFGTKKNLRNLSGQKNHAISMDKKITQPLGTKKIMQPLGTKKIMQPFRTEKNHATSRDNKKSCNL